MRIFCTANQLLHRRQGSQSTLVTTAMTSSCIHAERKKVTKAADIFEMPQDEMVDA